MKYRSARFSKSSRNTRSFVVSVAAESVNPVRNSAPMRNSERNRGTLWEHLDESQRVGFQPQRRIGCFPGRGQARRLAELRLLVARREIGPPHRFPGRERGALLAVHHLNA